MLYLLENTDSLGNDFLTWGLPYLSEQRKEKILRYGSVQDRIDGCAAYILLRIGLYAEYGIKEPPAFVYGTHDKPFLKDFPDIYFNLTHCKTALGCIISDSNTAIDITDYRKLRNNVSKRVCSLSEQQKIAESSEPDICFLKMWTRKECYAKLTGEGMSRAFNTITDELPEASFIHTEQYQNYILSYYAEKPQKAEVLQPQILKKQTERFFCT